MHPINILLVEDSEADRLLTVMALKKAQLLNKIMQVENGEIALRYLFKEDEFADASTPDLILLDINMPRISGIEVLERIKKDEKLKSIPVIMLTTSDNENDVIVSYKSYANCYITKPVDPNKFIEVVMSIESFWLSVVRLPQSNM